MDPLGEEQLDYEDEEYGGGGPKSQFQGGGAIPALAEEELMGEDDEYDDLYNDVNVGEGFMQSLQQTEPPVSGNGAIQDPKDVPGSRVSDPGVSQDVSIPGIEVEKNDSNVAAAGFTDAEKKNSGFLSNKGLEEGNSDFPDQKPRVLDIVPATQVGNIGFRGPVAPSMSQKIGVEPVQMPGKFVGGASSLPDSSARIVQQPMPVARMGVNRPLANVGTSVENGTTMLFVGELHWWTTDAELESELSRYGRVKEIKFFDERASGKSKGYCQVEFYDPAAAAACKEGMNGHMFNGRACVVAFASPQTLRQMGASYMNKTQMQAQSQQQQGGRRLMNDGVGRGGGMNYQGGDGGRNYGRGGWARGGQGLLNRGQGGGGPMRGRGPIGAKGMVGNTGGVGTGGNPYGQGLTGPGMGGPTAGLMHPQSMMGAGFDPTYMGRGAGYGGFSGPAFPGMMPSFPAVNTVALPGVAPHVNPAFFGRGVSANGMGIMGSSGMDGHHAGMWTDTNMGRWEGEEHGRRTRESSYGGDDGASDYGYGEEGRERGGRSNASREKDRGSERDWSGNSERRHRDEREQDWERSDRDRYREEKDGYRDHRQRERDWDNEDDWDRGQSSSRSRSKSRMMQEEDHRSRSRDADYGKRRRLPSE